MTESNPEQDLDNNLNSSNQNENTNQENNSAVLAQEYQIDQIVHNADLQANNPNIEVVNQVENSEKNVLNKVFNY
jgi:hypothetical protein